MSKRHNREEDVKNADLELRKKMLDWSGKWSGKLTDGEALRVINRVLGGYLSTMAKYQIRAERHGDENIPGGVEG